MHKAYIQVNAEFMPDGRIIPLSFTWEDGRTFDIDKLLEMRPAASLKAGGYGMRYTIRVCGQQRYLWLEDKERWFVEAPDNKTSA